MVAKKNLLLISLFFSPSETVGAKRFSYLSYYLKKNSYNVSVLTIKNKYYQHLDNTLKFDGKVFKSIMFPPFPIKKNNISKKILNWFWGNLTHTYFDPYIGWLLPGIIKGYNVIKKNNIDIIIVTGPPFSSFLIGYFLSQLMKTKLILDFRDPWTFYHGNLSTLGLKFCKWIEKKMMNFADALVFNTNKSAFAYKEFIHKEKIYVVANGFDSNMKESGPAYLEKDKIVILYTGNFYGDRKLNYLFEPIQRLYAKKLIKKDSIAIHVFGKLRDEDLEIINDLKFQNLVFEHDKVDYEKVISYMKGADILYLPQGGDVKYSVPFKFFDYLNAKKPILAVTSLNSAIYDIMQEIQCGEIADINSSDSIYNALCSLIVEKKIYAFDQLENYSWENITKKYIDIISTI